MLRQVAEECRKQGAESVDPWGVNLTDPAGLSDFSKQILDKYGKVDILVNCAGIIPSSEGVGQGAQSADPSNGNLLSFTLHVLPAAPRSDMASLCTGDINEWSMALNINLLAPMALTNAFAPKMQEQKVGPCCRSHAKAACSKCQAPNRSAALPAQWAQAAEFQATNFFMHALEALQGDCCPCSSFCSVLYFEWGLS